MDFRSMLPMPLDQAAQRLAGRVTLAEQRDARAQDTKTGPLDADEQGWFDAVRAQLVSKKHEAAFAQQHPDDHEYYKQLERRAKAKPEQQPKPKDKTAAEEFMGANKIEPSTEAGAIVKRRFKRAEAYEPQAAKDEEEALNAPTMTGRRTTYATGETAPETRPMVSRLAESSAAEMGQREFAAKTPERDYERRQKAETVYTSINRLQTAYDRLVTKGTLDDDGMKIVSSVNPALTMELKAGGDSTEVNLVKDRIKKDIEDRKLRLHDELVKRGLTPGSPEFDAAADVAMETGVLPKEK